MYTLQRSTTIVINTEIYDDNKTSKLEYITSLQAILKVLAPAALDDSKPDTIKNSPHSNTILTTAPTYPSKINTQSTL